MGRPLLLLDPKLPTYFATEHEMIPLRVNNFNKFVKTHSVNKTFNDIKEVSQLMLNK